jgi:hypothetical protein
LKTIYSFNRRTKLSFDKSYIDRNEHNTTIEDNKNDFELIGMNQESSKTIRSINSDLTKLYINLFNLSKFENSKPYKMIDYIINNDKTILSTAADKEMMEDIKKTISNLKIEKSKTHNDVTIPMFKSLYHFFRDDFSSSCLMKIVEKVNVALNESHKFNDDISNNKDRFTYQNYLTDKLRNYKDSFTEINDKEIFKAFIYLCNKNLKMKGTKCDYDFETILKENVKLFDSEDELNNSVIKLFQILEKDKKAKNYIMKRLDKLFADVKDIDGLSSNHTEIFNKIIDMFYQSREDEIDKIVSKLQKIDTLPESCVRNSLSLWFYFRLLYFLNLLNNDIYMSDEMFWKNIMNYCSEQFQEKPVPLQKPKLKKRK